MIAIKSPDSGAGGRCESPHMIVREGDVSRNCEGESWGFEGTVMPMAVVLALQISGQVIDD